MASFEEVEIEEWPFTIKKVEGPSRTDNQWHRCQCLLLCSEPGTPQEDRCKEMVRGPDNPFCPECEGRHPEYAESTMTEVTVWGLERGDQ